MDFLQQRFCNTLRILRNAEIFTHHGKSILLVFRLIAHAQMHIICRADFYGVFSDAFRQFDFFACKGARAPIWLILIEQRLDFFVRFSLNIFNFFLSSILSGKHCMHISRNALRWIKTGRIYRFFYATFFICDLYLIVCFFALDIARIPSSKRYFKARA